jgi:hypothetical protein
MGSRNHLWVKLRLAEVSVALLVVWLVIQISGFVRSTQREIVSPTSWFEVREIYVPDHVQGTNPPVTYDRVIHEDFRGFWVVEVQRREADGATHAACSGSGVSDYETTDTIPNHRVSWTWFVGRNCEVRPGQYRLRLSLDLTRPNWPPKRVVAFSNTFVVLPAE